MTRPAADSGTFPALCPLGHRRIPSTGMCWTMREAEPGLYEYVIGACEDLP